MGETDFVKTMEVEFVGKHNHLLVNGWQGFIYGVPTEVYLRKLVATLKTIPIV